MCNVTIYLLVELVRFLPLVDAGFLTCFHLHYAYRTIVDVVPLIDHEVLQPFQIQAALSGLHLTISSSILLNNSSGRYICHLRTRYILSIWFVSMVHTRCRGFLFSPSSVKSPFHR